MLTQLSWPDGRVAPRGHRRTSFPFGYERIDGILHFAVDPTHPANVRITDLDRAPRDADGRVRFQADFLLLQPVDPARGNRRLLYHVVNRGHRIGVPYNRFAPRPPMLPPSDEIDVGDGFLMRRGWTLAMCGWQWDVERQPGLLGLKAPQALGPDGGPLKGRVAVAFQPNEAHAHRRLAHWPLHPSPARQPVAHTAYPAADLGEPGAELTVRGAASAERQTIPRERWRFAREEQGRVVPDDSHVWLEGGFQPGRWYEVVYTTRVCAVVGTGPGPRRLRGSSPGVVPAARCRRLPAGGGRRARGRAGGPALRRPGPATGERRPERNHRG